LFRMHRNTAVKRRLKKRPILSIRLKTSNLMSSLIGSLCDLTSGSGDKGTPIVHIQGYFDNYTTE
ncbi:MAG: coenzyme F420-0:L-glutamate ligase, partial [Clostridia bacterium]|nr:coenzyme F420-0:L-glutamate ligase [Clostridia bacterium]